MATVAVDTPLAHLDRPFEYAVPAELDAAAVPGARVRVRLAGRDHDGFLLGRADEAEHSGRLTPLRSVVSPEPVLTPHVAELARAVADHYGGTLSDTLRLAVPARHARAERSVPGGPGGGPEEDLGSTEAASAPRSERDPAARTEERRHPAAWEAYPAGGALLRRLRGGEAPAASWLALPTRRPGADWPDAVADAVAATVDGGRGALVVVPDRRDVDRVLTALEQVVAADDVVRLTADLGPEARYRAFLRVLRGQAPVVVGTRASAFAPVRDLGLLVCWDEGDDLHHEPRAPYPHVREVLRLRAEQEGAALLLGGYARSVAVQAWVAAGAVASVVSRADTLRACAPRVVVAGEGHQQDRDPAARTARVPSLAWRTLKAGLEAGPVLVQVPRQGYVVGLACQDCRTQVRCVRCQGPVGSPGSGGVAACRWCGAEAVGERQCLGCGSTRTRATAVGERRTAEELGRAFPGVSVISSGGDHVVPEVDEAPALVVATPGAEPWCPTGYAAVALLDGWRLLERASLEAQPEALRRWCTAAALARTTRHGASVVLAGVPPHASIPAVEALVRWDPAWLAARELAERVELGLPPARRHAVLRGAGPAVREVATAIAATGQEVLGSGSGSAQDGGGPAAWATVAETSPGSLAGAVRRVRAERSARKATEAVRIVVEAEDPLR